MNQKLSQSHSGSAINSRLFRIGLLMAAVYLLALLFYFKGPTVSRRTVRTELFAWFFCISLLVLFWKGYRLIKKANDRPPSQTILGFAIVFCAITLFTFPFHSTDVFGYINRGWQQVHYGQNPYIYFVGDIPQWQQDPMIREHWLYNPDPYGFLFTLLARFLVWLGRGHWWLTLFLFKAVNAAAYALTGGIIWLGAKRFGHTQAVTALYLFLWNPLILLHEIANGHNDILTGCLVALAMYFAVIGADFWIIPVLVAATLMKYAPAILVPFAFVFVVKRKGWKVAILSSLAGGAIFAIVGAPYLRDWRLFRLDDIKFNATLIDNSLHSFLIHIYENVSHLFPCLARYHDLANTSIKGTLRFGFLLFLIFQFITIPQQFCANRLLKKSLLILFVLICVASSKFNAWYMAMLLPTALLLEPSYWLRRLIVLITAAQVLSFTFFKQAYIINYLAMMLIPTWIIFKQLRRERREELSADAAVDQLPNSAD
jgi:hypothetical protein